MGSTGSIGTQTLDIIAERSDLFRASVLTAGRNYRLLAEQALRFKPDKVVIADESHSLRFANFWLTPRLRSRPALTL